MIGSLANLSSGLVEGQQVGIALKRGRIGQVEVYPGEIAAALDAVAAAGVLDQNSAHGLSRRAEEMAAAVPRPIGLAAD